VKKSDGSTGGNPPVSSLNYHKVERFLLGGAAHRHLRGAPLLDPRR
jgi:hypothetical protein